MGVPGVPLRLQHSPSSLDHMTRQHIRTIPQSREGLRGSRHDIFDIV